MIRIIIADDQQLFRDLLEHMLKDNGEIEVTASVENGEEAVGATRELNPDVVLMDIIMPVCNGIEALKQIKAAAPAIKVLVLTVSHDENDVGEAMKSGADGYILKSVGKDELILAIKSVYSDMEVIHKDIRQIANEATSKAIRKKADKTQVMTNGIQVELTDRDLKIIEMVVEGKSSKEMADEIFVAEGRLRNIVTEIISKLMVKDRTQLAVFAIKNSLVGSRK